DYYCQVWDSRSHQGLF
nr:immunoglobulin light chain junction region [Macaca mulatta]